MRYQTRSIKGRAREENHDYADAMFDGTRGVFVIVDGTSRVGSGQLAHDLVRGMISSYQAHIINGADDTSHVQIEQLLRAVLAEQHTQLFGQRTGTTSYLVGVASKGLLTVAYEGDCACGLAGEDGGIEWITPPHCKANWRRDRTHRELAKDPSRNLVTRSFRANRTPEPDFIQQPAPAGVRFVFATDGFWAELTDAQQAEALNSPNAEIGHTDDDVTWIDVKL